LRILALNCGSSTLKFHVLDVTGDGAVPKRIANGSVERIGDRGMASVIFGEDRIAREVETDGHRTAFSIARELLEESGSLQGIEAIGHRVVHGGPRFRESAAIDDTVVGAIREVSELAPLHNRPALDVIEAARDAFQPPVPMVAAFDTAFFADLPDVSARYALPRDLSEAFGIRRFGFHGLAHRYMVQRFRRLRPDIRKARLITLQLGSGCSATASLDGRPVDTSMGYTPLEGLIMGTRTGDLDPAVPLRLQSLTGKPAAAIEDVLNTRSGLLGLSGRSAEMRDLLPAAEAGDRDSAFAIEAFCTRVRKYIGAYAALLGGMDGIVFGGGIGENLPQIRQRVCEGMQWAGVELDNAANDHPPGSEARISDRASQVDVWVTRVDEAEVIARETFDLLKRG
jgi:acetate kinase